MYYVYLIRSLKTDKYYIGYTENLANRIKEHNNGKSEATKVSIPYKLIYYEAYKSEKDARLREKMLKFHGQGIRRLKERLRISCK